MTTLILTCLMIGWVVTTILVIALGALAHRHAQHDDRTGESAAEGQGPFGHIEHDERNRSFGE